MSYISALSCLYLCCITVALCKLCRSNSGCFLLIWSEIIARCKIIDWVIWVALRVKLLLVRRLWVCNWVRTSTANLVMMSLRVDILEVSYACRVLRLDKGTDQCLTCISLMQVSFLRWCTSLTVNNCLHRALLRTPPSYNLCFSSWLEDTLWSILLVLAASLWVIWRVMQSTLVASG